MAKSLGASDISVQHNDGTSATPGDNFFDNGQDVDDNDFWAPGFGDGARVFHDRGLFPAEYDVFNTRSGTGAPGLVRV
jgi:hypothetical protein